MKKITASLVLKAQKHWPIFLVVFVAIAVASANIKLDTFYSGWDNVHGEFNLAQYAKRVFFGAWLEHQGLGAAAAQGHLAETTRIPILFFFKLFLPENLHRYVFIFLMYSVGGITMYWYLYSAWISDKKSALAPLLAATGGIVYLLHVLTLQQFYISFEMFMVQFAFFPLVLLSIHWLSNKFSAKNLLYFLVIQILLAASAHTQTVFYLGILSSLGYAFFVHLSKTHSILKAVWFLFLVGFFTGIAQSYWILPNLYFGAHNSHYVSESKANSLFGPESLWSIKESSTPHTFFTGLHYLLAWKDYNFATSQHERIFIEWENHLQSPVTQILLYLTTIGALFGLVISLFNKKKGLHRLAIGLLFSVCASFIWLDLFPTKHLYTILYQNEAFQDAFRNPFTKLSILYSFFLVVLYVEFLESALRIFNNISGNLKKIGSFIVLAAALAASVYIALPSFQGHFINEKLKVTYPAVYSEFFAFMQTQNPHARVIEMPYLSHEGWFFYDWSTPNKINGYQGMGFYFYGIPQPFLTPEFARWNEADDFLFQEVKHAVNNFDANQFESITKKYHVPFVIVDDSRISPYIDYDKELDHVLVQEAGFVPIWEKDFITLYEKKENHTTGPLLIPSQVTEMAQKSDRYKKDVIYESVGSYIVTDSETDLDAATLYFPFADLFNENLASISYPTETIAEISRAVPSGTLSLTIPGIEVATFNTTMALTKNDSELSVEFPEYTLILGEKRTTLPKLTNQTLALSGAAAQVDTVFINGNAIEIKNNETTFIEISISPETILVFTTNQSDDEPLLSYKPDWQYLSTQTTFIAETNSEITLMISFPRALANLTSQPSENCSLPKNIGSITTTYVNGSANYTATNFGVNCNATNLAFMTPATSYALRVKGENILGRSPKFFINYYPGESIAEEYILPTSTFDHTYALHKITNNLYSNFFINWETRSFGKESKNRLDEVSIVPVPMDRLARVRLQTTAKNVGTDNNYQVTSFQKLYNFVYQITGNCDQESCFVGINQSHDDLWVAYNHTTKTVAPHFKYNSWANIWKVPNGTSTITILYIPQLVSLFGMMVLFLTLVYLIRRSIAEYKYKVKSSLSKKIRSKSLYRTPKRVLAGVHKKRT